LFKSLANIFRIPELRNKLAFTIGLLCVYRIGFYVPLPGVDADALTRHVAASQNSPLGALTGYLSLFSGGSLGQSTIFGLGIMPYISASIILQLLATVLPSLEKLRKEGEPGMRKINEWTRYLTVGICIAQAWLWLVYLVNPVHNLLLPSVTPGFRTGLFFMLGLVVLTGGSVFLMWLGEQIDHYGIGNGVSLIITAGIISRMPDAVHYLMPQKWGGKFTLSITNTADQVGPAKLAFLLAAFVGVVAGSILLTQAQRRIRIQQAKQMRGRHVYGGQAQYLPLRVNHSGVMPIIFASSLLIFPHMGLRWVADHWFTGMFMRRVADEFNPGQFIYEIFYVGMIFFFSYFWNTVQFNSKEISNQLRDYGSFIPGLRPGKRTAEYLENVLNRITYVGAAFLSIIAVVPTVVSTQMDIPYQVSQFLGGTGLLIVISVMLDLVNRIEANLVMRDYAGFMDESGSGAERSIRRRGTKTGASGGLGPMPGSRAPEA